MITDAVDWIFRRRDKPWLVVGKGPGLDRRAEIDAVPYHVLTLGSACTLPWLTWPEATVNEAWSSPRWVDLALFMDWEAFNDAWPKAFKQRREDSVLCLPWYPHIEFKPNTRPLDLLLGSQIPSGIKVVSFNSTTARTLPLNMDLSTVRVRGFSSVAAFNLLGAAGVRDVHTLGLDGGTDYAKGLDRSRCLANGRRSFDEQFGELNAACTKYHIGWRRL